MTTKHDYAAALGQMLPESKQFSVYDGTLAHIGLRQEEYNAIIHALRVAAKLTGEPSEGMVDAGANGKWSDGYDRNGSHAEGKYVEYESSLATCVGEWRAKTVATEAYNAMVARALQEIEGE